MQRRRDTIMECVKTRNAHEKCKNLEMAMANTCSDGKLIIKEFDAAEAP
jgi:hypothetical protein